MGNGIIDFWKLFMVKINPEFRFLNAFVILELTNNLEVLIWEGKKSSCFIHLDTISSVVLHHFPTHWCQCWKTEFSRWSKCWNVCLQVAKLESSLGCIWRNGNYWKRAQAQLQVKWERNSQLFVQRIWCYQAKVTLQVFAVPLGMGRYSLDSKASLLILLAFPTVWTCSVVLTFTGQFAVVIHTLAWSAHLHLGRGKTSSLLSQIDLGDHWGFTQLSPRVVVLRVRQCLSATKGLLKCRFIGPTLRIFFANWLRADIGVMVQPDLIHFKNPNTSQFICGA